MVPVLSALGLLGTALPAAAEAPETATAERPRIGLVLGGGGARGAAHVGVLKVLDEMNVPIDAIVGTSMGAIVGGLYASGLSVEDVETIVRDANWSRLLTDRPPRADRSFRRKSDDFGFLVNFDVGLGEHGRVLLPRGIVQGQNFDLALRRYLLPVATIDDFNALPIPFRAVATDIVNGTEVAIGSGDLASAIRASMSAPGIFKPVRYDGRLLVDGGVTNNLPVDVARALGADIIIAVDVGFRLLPEEQLDSALKITNQMLTVLINGRARRQAELLQAQDMLIEPELGDIGSQEFARIAEAIDTGERAARQLSARLAPLGLPPGAYAARMHRLRDTRIPPPPRIDRIEIRNESKLSTEVLRTRIDQAVGEPLDADALAHSISDIYGFDTFETIDYRLRQDQDRTTLSLDATEKSWGPNFLRFGLNLEDDFNGTSNYNIAVRLTRTELNALGGELRADLQIGTSPLLGLEFFQPLDRAGRWFLNPIVQIGRDNSVVFSQGNRRFEFIDDQLGLSLQAGRLFSNTAELRVGITRTISDSRVYIGDPGLDPAAPNLTSLSLQYGYDALDNVAIPRFGITAAAAWSGARRTLGSDLDIDVLSFFILKPQTWGRNTLLHWWNLESTVNTGGDPIAPLSLGGLFSLSGLAQDEIQGRHAGMGRVLYYRRLGADKAPGLGMQMYVGASLEVGNVWQRGNDIGFDNTLVGGSAFIVLDTPLGPVYAAYGATEGGERSAWLFLGQTF